MRAETIHVVLVGGQSNANGRADPAGLPANLQSAQSDVLFYSNYSGGLSTLRPNGSTSQFGPEITLGRSMADYYEASGQKVAVLKYAVGGTNLYSQWAAGGTSGTTGDGSVYASFQSTINAGLHALTIANPTATIVIDGMVWMQGESDAADATNSSAYGTNLIAFIRDIRLTYGANLPFVIGELSVNQTGTGLAVYRNNVRSGQASVGSSVVYTSLVNTDSFELKSDNLHFDAIGQQALGNAFASSLRNLMAIPEASSYAAIFSVLTLGFTVRRRRGKQE